MASKLLAPATGTRFQVCYQIGQYGEFFTVVDTASKKDWGWFAHGQDAVREANNLNSGAYAL